MQAPRAPPPPTCGELAPSRLALPAFAHVSAATARPGVQAHRAAASLAVRLTRDVPIRGRATSEEAPMTVTSEAKSTWRGSLFDSAGEVSLASSGAGTFAVNWKARSEGS